ncbi:MAG: GNAT family N-acetyltransferase [Casimicrobium sp.]
MQPPMTALETFLLRNEFRHITPLKAVRMLGSRLGSVYLRVMDETAYLLWSMRDASHYDSAKYPTAHVVFYPALNEPSTAAMLDACAEAILDEARGRVFVVKTIEPRLVNALRAAAPSARVSYERALCTFSVTGDAAIHSSALAVTDAAHHIRTTATITDEARPLLDAHNNYSAGELGTMFADGNGRCFVSYHLDRAVAVALSFANSPSLYEIGSLYVAPDARRGGHATTLVHAALADLNSRGLAVRYVVDATNTPSIALAERCGLREAMRLEHWLVAGG